MMKEPAQACYSVLLGYTYILFAVLILSFLCPLYGPLREYMCPVRPMRPTMFISVDVVARSRSHVGAPFEALGRDLGAFEEI